MVAVLFRCEEELTTGTVWLQCCLDVGKNRPLELCGCSVVETWERTDLWNCG